MNALLSPAGSTTKPTGRAKLESENIFELKLCPGPGLCIVKNCRHKCVKKRWGGNLCLCAKHRQQRWRAKNPKQAAYRALKDHAAARGIPFSLSVEYFMGLTDAVGFWDHGAESRGQTLTLDRIVSSVGYHPGNVRIITVDVNQVKGNKERHLSPQVQAILAKKRARMQAHLDHIDKSFKPEWDPTSDEDPF